MDCRRLSAHRLLRRDDKQRVLTPEQFGRLVADETEKWAKVVAMVELAIE